MGPADQLLRTRIEEPKRSLFVVECFVNAYFLEGGGENYIIMEVQVMSVR